MKTGIIWLMKSATMFPGHPFCREDWADLKLEPRHDLVASFWWYPVPPAKCHCVCAHGTDLPRHLQVGSVWLYFSLITLPVSARGRQYISNSSLPLFPTASPVRSNTLCQFGWASSSSVTTSPSSVPLAPPSSLSGSSCTTRPGRSRGNHYRPWLLNKATNHYWRTTTIKLLSEAEKKEKKKTIGRYWQNCLGPYLLEWDDWTCAILPPAQVTFFWWNFICNCHVLKLLWNMQLLPWQRSVPVWPSF